MLVVMVVRERGGVLSAALKLPSPPPPTPQTKRKTFEKDLTVVSLEKILPAGLCMLQQARDALG